MTAGQDLPSPSPPPEPLPAPPWAQPPAAGPPSAPAWGAPGPAQSSSGPRRPGIRKRWIVLAVLVGLVGFYVYQTWQQEQNYQTGHAAYLAADCARGVGPLRNAAEGEPGSASSDVALKAKAELQECEALLSAADLATQGKRGEAVLAYSDIVTKYPRSPLKDAALAKGQGVIAGAPDKVATIGLCDALDTLEAQQFVAAPADSLPPLLYACGQVYEANEAYAEALAAYARFRSDYPDHALAADVDAAFARATLAETAATGAESLPPPDESGTGAAGVATILIQNDSPDQLTMVFSGPDVRVEALEACAGCVKFTAGDPHECQELGPIGEYKVAPGTYEVVVKSGSGTDVIPFRGTWTLEAGQEYASCFFIVTGQ